MNSVHRWIVLWSMGFTMNLEVALVIYLITVTKCWQNQLNGGRIDLALRMKFFSALNMGCDQQRLQAVAEAASHIWVAEGAETDRKWGLDRNLRAPSPAAGFLQPDSTSQKSPNLSEQCHQLRTKCSSISLQETYSHPNSDKCIGSFHFFLQCH